MSNTIRFRYCLILIVWVSIVSNAQKIERWSRFEVTYQHISTKNPCTDVKLTATFKLNDSVVTVSGFYDGDNTWKIRFMPEKCGNWRFQTHSNIALLDKRKGEFECIPATGNSHGIVRVGNIYNFIYSDGTQYYPFGTTAYAWTNMHNDVQELTLKSFSKSGFNKVRMCVFPKNYDLVKEEPDLYPFEIKELKKDGNGNEIKIWDFTHFNPTFFQHLEKRIDDLNTLGIEADLILFHPYDKGRWGFDAMPNDVNIRYIQYLTARLSSFHNVWWSMANEWDFVKSKTIEDWLLLTKIVSKSDPYHHLCSIHGASQTFFNYNIPEISHVSIQDETPVQLPSNISMLRSIYHKPIVCDEVGYEGNLKNRWGRYSPEEMTYLVWNGIIGGGYVTHGECYMQKDANDTIFWAKGGDLKGTSWKRIAFLRNIVEALPAPLSLADPGRDNTVATTGNGTYLVYFGKQMNEYWAFNLPSKNGSGSKLKSGKRFKVEIIDSWDMTIKPVAGIFETAIESDYRLYDKEMKKIRLPLKPYVALRITELN